MWILQKKKWIVLFFLVFSGFFFYGCQEEVVAPVPQPKRPPVKKKAVAPAEKEEVKKEEPEKIEYVYDPAGKRDPFLPFIASISVSEEEEEEEQVPLTELQKYDLSQLKLVAVMKMKDKNLAMVQDPMGKGHTIYVGTWIGKNRGKVSEILKNKVLVAEKFRDAVGEIKIETKELVIEAPEGGLK